MKTLFLYLLLGVMNGPWKFLTARKILPLLDLPAKFKRSKLLVARKANFLSLLVLAKKSQCTACSRMLAKTRHPYFLYRQYLCWKALFWGSSITSCWCVRLYPGHRTPCKSLIHVSTYRVQISLPAALRLLWVLIIPNLLLLLCCVHGEIEILPFFPGLKLLGVMGVG